MVQFWSKLPPKPSFHSDAQAHVAADWTLLMWHVAQLISDCNDASPKEFIQASSRLTSMSGPVCVACLVGWPKLVKFFFLLLCVCQLI